MAKKMPQHVASDAWDWLKDAEAAYHQADDNSLEQMAAIQAMAMASLCG